MIAFLRKYQRVFFAMITVIIIATFTFFGTHNVAQQTQIRADRVIGKMIDGYSLRQNEVKRLSHFLSLEGVAENGYSNVFNDGVISKDFLQTGLGKILAISYFGQIESQLQKSFEKSKKWTFYSHPQVPFLSAKEIWSRLQPEALGKIETLAKVDTLSVENIGDYFDLQVASHMLPSDYVKQILILQQGELPWVTPDQRLVHDDLSLFGFHHVADWMGNDFVDLVSQFILNTSREALQRGYTVSWEEAKHDLYKNAFSHINKLHGDMTSHSSQKELFDMHLRYLGMDEKTAIDLWSNVLLFRKFVHDVGQNVFLDSLAVGDFSSYVKQKAQIEKYSLSKGLELKDFSDLMAFQVYLKAIGPDLANDREYISSIPDIFFSVEDIESRYPQLVEKCYEVSLKKAKLDAISVRIAEKELWDWQLDHANWTVLNKEFSLLSSLPSNSREDRFESLESLSSADREKVDEYSRLEILKTLHMDWIKEELNKASPHQIVLHLRAKGGKAPLEGINDQAHLANLLESSPTITDTDLSDELRAVQSQLQQYTDDNHNYYCIDLIRKAPAKRVISFEEGMSDGTITNLVDHYLETQYTSLRKQNPANWKDEKGNWLSLYDAKEKLGKVLFENLLKSMGEKTTLDSYAHGRFKNYLDRKREEISVNQGLSSFVRQDKNALEADYFSQKPEFAFKQQWQLIKEDQQIDRNEKNQVLREMAFSIKKPNTWSDSICTSGESCFFILKQYVTDDSAVSEEISRSKNALSNEAICQLAKGLIEQIQEKHAIVLPVYQELIEDHD